MVFLLAGTFDLSAEDNGGALSSVRYAAHFKLAYLDNGYKVVTDGAGRELLLCPRGKAPLPGYEDLPRIEIPVTRVALNSTINAALLRPLGLLDTISGICIDNSESYIDGIQSRIEAGDIVDLGNGNPMDYERLRALNPEIVFARDWNQKLLPMLDKLNIPVAIVDFFDEKHPLAQTEWVKFLAAFYDKEDEANRFFEKAARKVDAVSITTARATKKPRILSGGVYLKKVHVPRPDSCQARMFALAGGDYLFNGLEAMQYMVGYGSITLEEFYMRARDADLYILEVAPGRGIASMRQLMDAAEILRVTKPVREKKIWITQPWYWESIDKREEVVEDLAAIIHPDLFPGYQLKYFLKLPEE